MLSLALSLFVAPAWSCGGPTHNTDCHLDDLDEALDDEPDDDHPVHLELGLEGTALPGAPATGVFADLTGPHDAFLRGEGRVSTEGRYMGRLSTGVDVLGDKPFDVRLGLFIGHVGVWQSEDYHHLAIGTDITLGAELGRVSGAIRWIGGKRTQGGFWNETDISLGYRVLGPFELTGHWLRMDGGEGERSAGVGLGGSVTF